MPPTFTQKERERVTGILLETGLRLFTTQGLRKTSLAELVAPAGIAKSSFYAFFDSKEALYLTLMERRSGEVRKRVIDDALLSTPDTREALRRFLYASVTELSTEPLYRRLATHPEEMAAVARKVSVDALPTGQGNLLTALNDFVTARRSEGELVGADPAAIVGALQSVLLLPMNTEHLAAPGHYQQTLDLVIDLVVSGLTATSGLRS
ncbi:TetR/AcrR family transcriptional regulator [Nocardiopsis sp. HNM0947]|uniref:TetR/AcrR family transcriptional regulator n=1 Tax=Nocardiopsis coralli TaxID=2772213 RepID=A0ABR9PA27_9ACTN|nr:TetR/AcrR family transcriptional regulator [Nocardiopsis coralli]MBE3000679.1 TetR/AcrR family transcriptional regulator [Nocardiopsis coralli]